MLLEASDRLLTASAMSETEPARRPAIPLPRQSATLRPMQMRLAAKPACVLDAGATVPFASWGARAPTSDFTNNITTILVITFLCQSSAGRRFSTGLGGVSICAAEPWAMMRNNFA